MTSDLVEMHAQALSYMTSVIHGIADDSWGNQSPCEDWSVREVVNHITAENLWAEPLMNGMTIEQVGDQFEGDVLGVDPMAAWDAAAKGASAAFTAGDALQKTVHVSWGDISAQQYLEQMTSDLIIHGWDIAKGSGQDDRIPEPLVRTAMALLQPMVESGQTSSVFSDPLPVEKDADAQTKLLAITGRRR
jgi:uncharacterized protein (TIGR03086 family)